VMVEYAPVQIGARNFICPVRSLALDLSSADGNSGQVEVPTEWLNVASYSGYHRFASTTVILAKTSETQPEKIESASESPQTTSPAPEQTASAIESTTPAGSGLPPSSSPLDSPTESASTAPIPVAPATTVLAPMLVPPTESTAAVSNARANQPQTPGITLQVNVNRVLVPVVVRDQQGHTVSDLKKEDFQLFDNNKPRAISAFIVEQNGASQGQRFIVLLFDDLHMSFVDLENAKKAGEKALDGLLEGSNQVAVLSLSGKVASGLTRDRARLEEAILSLKSQGDYLHLNEACLKMGYVQAWLMEFPQETAASHNAAMQLIACGASSDPQEAERTARLIAQRIVRGMGRDYVNSFSAINEVVRRMATLPGQRTLILISPGFEIRDPQVSAAQSQTINLAAQSSVTINTLSPRGLYTTFMTASNDNAEVQDLTSGYAMQDIRVAESSLSDLADGTGGAFFHNSNDLEAGFKALAGGPESVYLLELSLDNVKPDGAFHRLKVKVNRDGLQAQARRGYFMPKPEKAKQ
jgi:VWFA-related protein